MVGLLEDALRTVPPGSSTRSIERGEADLVDDIAAELPLQAIAEIIGVPQEDRHMLFDWSNRMIGIDDPEYAARRRQTSRGRPSCSSTSTSWPSSGAPTPATTSSPS